MENVKLKIVVFADANDFKYTQPPKTHVIARSGATWQSPGTICRHFQQFGHAVAGDCHVAPLLAMTEEVESRVQKSKSSPKATQ